MILQIYVRICQIQNKNHADVPRRTLLSLELRLGKAKEALLCSSGPFLLTAQQLRRVLHGSFSHRLKALSLLTVWGNYEWRWHKHSLYRSLRDSFYFTWVSKRLLSVSLYKKLPNVFRKWPCDFAPPTTMFEILWLPSIASSGCYLLWVSNAGGWMGAP